VAADAPADDDPAAATHDRRQLDSKSVRIAQRKM
jgi:hypothetical protein